MALIRNGRNLFGLGSGTLGGVFQNQTGNNIKGGLKNRFLGAFDATFGGYNNGALSPSAFIMPLKSGSISSYNQSRTNLTQQPVELIPAMPMIASASFSLNVINSQLDQIVQLIADGVLSLTGSASLAAAVSAEASSTMTLAYNAILGGIIPIEASSTTQLSSSVTLTAQAFIEAIGGGPTELSPEGLASAVLNAMLADFNDTGTVGEALNSIGASANPWSSDLSSNNSPGTFGEHVQKLLKTSKFIGLK